ncbi:MAG: MATE family efflux transporter, partial [Myxococcota bacterium]|nr:MATE family efflux transporter [Myxococcota bacterium]
MSNRHRILPWRERPLRELTRLSWPIAVSMLSFGVMTLVDTLFVSRLGAPALAGVGLAATATFALLCFSMGLLRGVKFLVSQSVGAEQRGELGAHLGAGLLLAAALGVVTTLLGRGLAELLPYLAAS